MNCFYMFIKNTLCCSFKITSITEVADSIKFVVFMLLKKSLMFCFIITLAAGITLSFKGRLERMCVLIWLKFLYNQIVFMGNKIIHESPYKYFKIFFLCCFIVTMTACEISPHMDRFCFMITLYAWVTNSFRDRLNKLFQITLSCCFMITLVAHLKNSFMDCISMFLNTVFCCWLIITLNTVQYTDNLYTFFKTWFLSCFIITLTAGIKVLVSVTVFIVHFPNLEKYIISIGTVCNENELSFLATKSECHYFILHVV